MEIGTANLTGSFRLYAMMALQQAQYVVLSAPDGERAFELLTELAAPPDVLVVDLRLPDMKGKDLVCRARLPISVLYVSADERARAEARVAARPQDAVLAKSFSAEQLLTRVRQMAEGDIDPEPHVA